MAENRSQVKKDDICQKMAGNGFPRVSRRGHRGSQEDHSRKWLKMAKKDFRGYLVGNGFPRVSRRGHRGDQAGNGRKWLKMAGNGRKKVHRGYLVGNGFPRILRHSPTTSIVYWIQLC